VYFNSNWNGYESFQFSILNQNPLKRAFTVKIAAFKRQAVKHETEAAFVSALWMQPGWNHYRLSINKMLSNSAIDITKIRSIRFMMTPLKQPSSIYLDSLTSIYLDNLKLVAKLVVD